MALFGLSEAMVRSLRFSETAELLVVFAVVGEEAEAEVLAEAEAEADSEAGEYDGDTSG